MAVAPSGLDGLDCVIAHDMRMSACIYRGCYGPGWALQALLGRCGANGGPHTIQYSY